MVQIMHLRIITSRSRPFCKYHNALCLGGNFEAIHMELIGKRELDKQYYCAPGDNINNNFLHICPQRLEYNVQYVYIKNYDRIS